MSAVFGAEHFIITHSPEYVQFLRNGDKLALSQVPDLITATYGLTPARVNITSTNIQIHEVHGSLMV